MNSADKLIDDGTVLHPTTGQLIPEGRLLGMERTVVKQDNSSTWFQSEAWLEQGTFLFDTPLDEEMGTGHLNAKRALQQFMPGEHEVNGHFGTPIVGNVPHIGWDFGTIEGASFPINKYKLEGTLEEGHFFTATLAWDRTVNFSFDADEDGEFDSGDEFQEYTDLDDVLTNLDLYLVPAGTNDVGDDDIAISQSKVFPVEHIFTEIPFTGEYELWVFRNSQFVPDQNYGLAWWYGLAPDIEPPNLSGDFDSDGDVDGADFLVWQRNPTMFNLADWQAGYGSPLSTATAVPEPANAALLLLAAGVLLKRRKH